MLVCPCLATLTYMLALNVSFQALLFPLMKDPLRVLEYDSWWRKDLHNILPYVIPAVKEDIIEKMEVQLEDSSNRIANTRTNGEAIVSHLQSLIDEQKVERTSPFS